jgi:hypothetical protein
MKNNKLVELFFDHILLLFLIKEDPFAFSCDSTTEEFLRGSKAKGMVWLFDGDHLDRAPLAPIAFFMLCL